MNILVRVFFEFTGGFLRRIFLNSQKNTACAYVSTEVYSAGW
jgi:hypothetical protein